ncbi:unnamed protein product [Paramecium octaurelia]|uniref:Anoctamin transmembrane domain-containing protein n=1 Tax=Paramecium octaurelia TaxID=43137 RepID=A0A8S1TBZ1_PAROT|nr:unnamed protein product [Paramecium octaurelia]
MKVESSKNKRAKQNAIQNHKEESIREILGFYINQVDLKSFMKKKKIFEKVGDLVDKHQNEFLNPAEFQEIQDIYEDYNIGDLAIVFPNPDYEGYTQKAVTFNEAATIFDEILTVMTEEVTKNQIKKERDSFLLTYLTLDDLIDNQNEGQVKKKKKLKQKKDPEKKKKMNKNQNNYTQEFAQPKDEKPIKIEKSSYEKYLDFMRIYHKQREEELMNENEGFDIKNEKGFLDEIGVGQQDQQNVGQKVIDPIKELMKVDVNDDKQFKRLKKKWSQGGYLVKKMCEDGVDYDWISNNGAPKDMMTLIRFTILEKLSRNGYLHCRQFVSGTGEHIYIVIKSTKEVIQRQAQNMKVTKQIEMGFADLFSLEPVDANFRPLRLKNYIKQIMGPNYGDLKEAMDLIKLNEKFHFTTLKEIDEYCETNYKQEIKQLKDIELRAMVIKKLEQLEEYFKIIAKQLNIDQSHEKVELNSDYSITDEEWQVYYIYLDLLSKLLNLLQLHYEESIKEAHFQFRDNLPFLYRLIFGKALRKANEIWYSTHKSCWSDLLDEKIILRNIWDMLGMEPAAPYTQYFQLQNDFGKQMWRKYEINELKDRSEFNNMEKIKITHAITLKHVNMSKLLQSLIAVGYFPIHDTYALFGEEKKEKFMKKLIEQEFIMEKTFEGSRQCLLELYRDLQSYAESTDFDFQSVKQDLRINFRCPWYIPVHHLRDYFGEKIALYFAFLGFYTQQLWYIGLVGILCQALLSESTGQYKKPIVILFSFTIVIWSSLFIVYWRRKQFLFSVQFGQLNFETGEALRPAFQGDFLRSITDDDLNEQFYPPIKRKITQLFGLAVSFLIILCVIGCVLGIFFFKNYMIETKADPFFSQQLPGLLNSILIAVFNFIYQNLVMIFNSLENHKILSSYENSLVAKVFIFRFVNTFNSFFIISFLSSYFSSLELCKVNDGISDCFQILSLQLSTIFISNFSGLVTAVVVPYVQEKLMKKMKAIDEIPVPHAFNDIDPFIESQFALQPYQTNEEVDGSVKDYMELTIQFCFLVVFGVSYPACFILGFAQNVGKIQVDKINFVSLSRRPFPQGAASIGNWLVILDIITFFGILSNAGLLVYTSNSIEDNKIEFFASILVIFFALNFVIKILVSPESESATLLLQRHQYIIDKKIKGFTSNQKTIFDRSKLNIQIKRVGYHLFNSGVINNEFLKTIKGERGNADD